MYYYYYMYYSRRQKSIIVLRGNVCERRGIRDTMDAAQVNRSL